MGKKIRLIVALAIVVGVLFWGIDKVRQRNYNGARIAFEVGSGQVMVTNRGSEPIPVEMRAYGRLASFRVESTELGLREGSRRVGAGRNMRHAIAFELPPGTTSIDVTRGSNVRFVSGSNQRIDAVVTPLNRGATLFTLIFTGLVSLAGIYYISSLSNHSWSSALRDRLPVINWRLRRT